MRESLEPYDEAAARRVAWIMGASSAAAKSIADLERRRSNGESVGLFICRHSRGTAVVVAASSQPRLRGNRG